MRTRSTASEETHPNGIRKKTANWFQGRKVRLIAFIFIILIVLGALTTIAWTTANCGKNTESEPEYTLPTRLQFFIIVVNLAAPPDIDIGVWLHYHGVLTAGKEVTVTATGHLDTPLAMTTVELVDVGFKFALAYPPQNETNGLPATASVNLIRYPIPSLKIWSPNLTEQEPSHIYWADAGDYAPTIVVTYWNHTNVQGVFPNTAVHVEPRSETVSENFSCVNTGLTYALVVFGVIEIVLSAKDWFMHKIDKPPNAEQRNSSKGNEEK